MRAYYVASEIQPNEVRGFAGTQVQAGLLRRELMAQFGLPLKDIGIAEVEIPTVKEHLLKFLNGLIEVKG